MTAIYLTTFKVKKSKYSSPSEVDMARREEWKSRLRMWIFSQNKGEESWMSDEFMPTLCCRPTSGTGKKEKFCILKAFRLDQELINKTTRMSIAFA
jgi:hypothetical protein